MQVCGNFDIAISCKIFHPKIKNIKKGLKNIQEDLHSNKISLIASKFLMLCQKRVYIGQFHHYLKTVDLETF